MPKITEFLTKTTLADEDIFVVIDVNDDTMSLDGTNKIINASDAANSLASKITSVPTIVSNALTAKANIASPTFTGNVVLPSTTTIGSISSTELSYLDGVTSAIQTQLNAISDIATEESPTFSGTVTAASFVGPLTGNSSTASTLQTSRAIACSGDIVGTTNFNGSANVSIATTLSDGVVTPSKLSIGKPTWNTAGTLTATLFSGPLTGTASGNIKQGGGTGQGNNNIYIGWNSPTGPKLRVQVDNTDFSSTWPIDISGNAATATTVADASITAAKLSGGQTGTAPIYGCRAWIYFDGSNATTSSGTATRVDGSTTATINIINHGLVTGDSVFINFGASIVDNVFVITRVDDNSFTVPTGASTGVSTTAAITKITIIAGGNIGYVSKISTGSYVVNFITSLPSGNFAIAGSGQQTSGRANSDANGFVNGYPINSRSAYISVVNTSPAFEDWDYTMATFTC